MNRKEFDVHTCFESSTYYSFKSESSDIFLKDTKKADKEKYLTLHIDKDHITYLDTAFYLCGVENVTLDFEGAVITLHGRIQPFIIDSCKNVTIKNVTVEYERALYTELDIISNTGKELRTRAKDRFPCKVENGYFIPYANEWEDRNVNTKCMFMQAFDRESRQGDGIMVIYLGEEIVELESPPASNVPHIKVRSEGDDIIFIGDFPKHWDSTNSIAIEHDGRDISNAAVYHSKDIVFENYRILNGGGMGFFSVYTENITLKSVKLCHDELSHGIVSNAADGIHFVASKGKIKIIDSIFEGMIDDALNIHSNYYHVAGAADVTVFARRSSSSHSLSARAEVFKKGDVIAVYSGRTLEEKDRFTVRDVRITGDWTLEIDVDKPTSALCEEDTIENLSTNAEVLIKNTRCGKSNTHLRFQTRGKSVIEDCEFELPLMLTGDMNYWFESSPANDLTVRNCKFIGNRAVIKIIPEFTPTEKAPYYHSGINITGNTFDNNRALYARNADNLRFVGNLSSNGAELTAELHDCNAECHK